MSNVTKFTDGFELIRDAKVKVTPDFTPKSNKPIAVIEIDGRVQHKFTPTSRVSLAMNAKDVSELENRFNGGTFFVKDGKLLDFRYNESNAFIHTNDSIQSLIDHIGFIVPDKKRVGYRNTVPGVVSLEAVRSNVEIMIPEYSDGGNMNSQLSFTWNPFQRYVSSAFELVRLICLNGMTGLSSFLNTKIPVINQWEDHLDIANKRIQTQVTSMIESRMKQMAGTPATIRDCQRVVDYCQTRLDKSSMNHHTELARKVLMDNMMIADPAIHLKDHYHASIFNDRRATDQLSSHLSMFTLWNMLTEIVSHTYDSDEGNAFAIHKHANEMVFDRGVGSTSIVTGSVNLSSVFNNVEAALVGDQL